MKKLKNNSGSALLWTVMVLGLLTVFCTAVLTMSMAYSKRNLNQNQNQQAYYTALSAVDLVAKQFNGIHAKGSSQFKIIEKLEQGDIITIDDMDLPPELGSCTVTMQMRNDDIVITADAEKDGMSYRLSGIMEGTEIPVWNPDTPGYGGDDTPAIGAGSFGGGGAGMGADPDTDMYIWNSGDKFELDTKGDSNNAIQMGALYTKGNVDIQCEKHEYTHLHGEIISDGNVTISDVATVGLLEGELLPSGHSKCCDNTDTSFIHAMGAVEISESGVIGGDIRASSIFIKDSARVHGNLEADIVTVNCDWNQNTNIVGDIKANTVKIGTQSTIIGDITANNVEITGQPIITGTITAQNITISSDTAKESYTNIVANNLTMSGQAQVIGDVTTAILTMTDGSKIVGNVVTDEVTLTTKNEAIVGTLSYFLRHTAVVSKVNGTVTQLGAQPPIPVTDSMVSTPAVEPVTSLMPPKPAAPIYPPKPDSAAPLSGSAYVTVGDGDKDCYYTTDKSISFSELRVEGTGRIFIYVPDGATCTFNKMSGGQEDHPNVFFILGNNSILHITSNGYKEKGYFYLFVWSREGSGAALLLGHNRIINGGIWVDKVNPPVKGMEEPMDNEFHWLSPPDISDILNGTPPGPEDPENPDPPEPTDPPEPPDPENPEGPEAPEEPEIIINWSLAAYENK